MTEMGYLYASMDTISDTFLSRKGIKERAQRTIDYYTIGGDVRTMMNNTVEPGES